MKRLTGKGYENKPIRKNMRFDRLGYLFFDVRQNNGPLEKKNAITSATSACRSSKVNRKPYRGYISPNKPMRNKHAKKRTAI